MICFYLRIFAFLEETFHEKIILRRFFDGQKFRGGGLTRFHCMSECCTTCFDLLSNKSNLQQLEAVEFWFTGSVLYLHQVCAQ